MMDLATQLAEECKASNQFTDLKNFSLRCQVPPLKLKRFPLTVENNELNFNFSLRSQVCNTLLKGQEEAQAHAKKTAHTAFAEIKK